MWRRIAIQMQPVPISVQAKDQSHMSHEFQAQNRKGRRLQNCIRNEVTTMTCF